jgi:hypothetical protein
MEAMVDEISKWIVSGKTVWAGGQAWATCDTPGQAARIAEDMNAVDGLRARLDIVKTIYRKLIARGGVSLMALMYGEWAQIGDAVDPTLPVATGAADLLEPEVTTLRERLNDVLDVVEIAVTDAASKGDGRVGLKQTRALGDVLFKYRPTEERRG